MAQEEIKDYQDHQVLLDLRVLLEPKEFKDGKDLLASQDQLDHLEEVFQMVTSEEFVKTSWIIRFMNSSMN